MKKVVKRKLLAICAALTMLCVIFAFGCQSEDNSSSSSSDSSGGGVISSDWTEMPENTNENLKYFGYFHSDGFKTQGSYINEISALKNANVAMINSAFSNADAVEKIAAAKNAGLKVIVSVHNLFTGGVVGSPASATLVENYQDVWGSFATAVSEYITDGTVLAFYFDEPAWQGIGEDDFRTVTQMIRTQYPNVKVITTMTSYDIGISKKDGYPELNASYNEYCTDVMYDNYSNWNDSVRREWIEKLKAKALQNQFIWGCATGFSTNAEQTAQMTAAIKGMYTEAIQEPRYAGIISFSYADGIDADWGYGLHTFFDNSSDYYDRDLRRLYINIGREVIGEQPYDFSKDIDLMLTTPNEVYNLGERVDLPAAGATDGNGNVIAISYEITSPSGATLEAESFKAEESGLYTVTVSAGTGENKVTKSTYISVRYPDEISTFDSEAHLADAGGTDADVWCWARQIDNTFSHSGKGSLKVTPHSKDGTWPRIIFNRNGYAVWDLSQAESVSMWVYNTGDNTISGFALVIADEDNTASSQVYTTVSLPSKVWTEVEVSIDFVKGLKPDLDLTKATVFYGNAASDYKDRSVFYVDDVKINAAVYEPDDNLNDFENAADIARIGTNQDDNWVWPIAISSEQAHGGSNSLKITPHKTDGTWPNVAFIGVDGATFNLTEKDEISLWVYFDSDNAISTLGLKVNNGEHVNEAQKTFEIAARTWTKLTLTKAEIVAQAADIDLTKVNIKFSQLGGTYTDRSNFYLDDFAIVKSEPIVTEDKNALNFENATDIARIGTNADDLWAWAVSISAEQHHDGSNSLKITARQDAGVWPNVVFLGADAATFDISAHDEISVWVYFDSDNAISTLGFKVNNGEHVNEAQKTYEIAARTWTKITLTKTEIVAQAADIDLTKVNIKFSQLGGTYTDRSNFYLDDFAITKAE